MINRIKWEGGGNVPQHPKKMTSTQMAKRGIWYFMRTLLLICLLAGACYGVFTTAMRMSNLYILVTEGLPLRAECILQDGSFVEMGEYFTQNFLEDDTALYESPFQDYSITNFDYRLEVQGISVWPWSKTGTVTVVERMASMSGTILEEKKPADAAADATYPLPEWEPAKYLVRLRNVDGRWYIYQMQLLETAPTEVPKRTPDMRMSPQPVPTPTPTPVSVPQQAGEE